MAILAAALAVGAQAHAETLAIKNVTVIDGRTDTGRPGMTVVVDGERIAAVGPSADVKVPAGATIVDGAGKYLLPGLADMHNHVAPPTLATPEQNLEALRHLLTWGITTVFSPGIDLPSFHAMKRASAETPSRYPRYFAAGLVIVVGDSYPLPGAFRTVATVDAARAAVRDMRAEGVDMIKFLLQPPALVPIRPEINEAIVAEAHALGLKAVAHAIELETARAVLRAGADGVVHGIIDARYDREVLELLKRNGAFYEATAVGAEPYTTLDADAWRRRLHAFDDMHKVPARTYALLDTPEMQAVLAQVRQQLKATGWAKRDFDEYTTANLSAVHDAGVPIVIGTDSPVPGVLPGVTTLLEMQITVAQGLSPIDTIRAATINAQRVLGRDARSGTIEVGKDADLILLYADPLADIANLRRLKAVIQAGVYMDAAAAQ